MIDSSYFEKKRQELGMERYDVLQKVQTWLDGRYPGQARAVSLNKGVLRIQTPSSVISSEIRMNQTALLAIADADRIQVSVATS